MIFDIIKVAFGHGPPDPHQPRRTKNSRRVLRFLQAGSKTAVRDLRQLSRAAASGGSSRTMSVDQLTSDMFELRGMPDENGNPGPLPAQRSSSPDPAPKSRPRARTWLSNPHLGPQAPHLTKRATAPAVMGPHTAPLCWYLKGPLSGGSDSSGAPVRLKPGKRKPISLRRQFQGHHPTHYFDQSNTQDFMRDLKQAGNVLYVDTGIVARLAPHQTTQGRS